MTQSANQQPSQNHKWSHDAKLEGIKTFTAQLVKIRDQLVIVRDELKRRKAVSGK